ncbi:MAG: dihydropteroate synthase [Alphaproteobacteria bacterium]|nr:dihydropteroate synthase [Alphaproteobacteria bacterium]
MTHEPGLISALNAGETRIMGVVNVTPDSFSDGGNFFNPDKAIEHGLQLLQEGAHVLDIGGESSRPGAQTVDAEEEIARVVPVIEGLREKAPFISIDTRNAKTMEAALKAGANIINDISALTHDSRSIDVAAQANVPVILMHMAGTPQNMQKNPSYNNVIEDVFEFFKRRIEHCETHRLKSQNLVLDPGIGFGKTLEHNLLILRNIKEFSALGCPILLGTSRKSFIGKIDGEQDANKRLGGSLSSVIWGLSQGVKFFRVHDVRETVQAIKVYEAILEAESKS